MNKERRKAVAIVITRIEEARDRLLEILDDEQAAFDNLPESIQYSEKGEAMEEAVDQMDEAYGNLDDAIELLREMVE